MLKMWLGVMLWLSGTGLVVPHSIPEDFIWPPFVEADVKWGFSTGSWVTARD